MPKFSNLEGHKISPHFQWSEAADEEGHDNMTSEVMENIRRMSNYLEKLRSMMDRPLVITSWYRSPDHSIESKKEHGPGAHSTGLAVDIRHNGVTDAFNICKIAMHLGFTGIGVGKTKSIVHLDLVKSRPGIAPRPAMWPYK